MSTPLTAQARPVVEDLLAQDADQLYAQLGASLQAMRNDAALAGSFKLAAAPTAAMGTAPLDALRTFGQNFFTRVSAQAYDLICGSDAAAGAERASLLSAFGSGATEVGAVLATLLVAQLGLAPAIATVVAALVIKLFFKPAYESMCATWKAGLSQPGPTTASTAPAQPGG